MLFRLANTPRASVIIPAAISAKAGSMLSVDAKGVFPIAPTPFVADGAIDSGQIDR